MMMKYLRASTQLASVATKRGHPPRYSVADCFRDLSHKSYLAYYYREMRLLLFVCLGIDALMKPGIWYMAVVPDLNSRKHAELSPVENHFGLFFYRLILKNLFFLNNITSSCAEIIYYLCLTSLKALRLKVVKFLVASFTALILRNWLYVIQMPRLYHWVRSWPSRIKLDVGWTGAGAHAVGTVCTTWRQPHSLHDVDLQTSYIICHNNIQ